MLTFSLLAYLSTAFAFISTIPLARKSSISYNQVLLSSSNSDEGFFKAEPDEIFWTTEEGLNMEVLAMKKVKSRNSKPINERVYGSVVRFLKKWTNKGVQEANVQQPKAPILFIHGSFHSAWCFAENYLDYFSSLGHHCYAVSLRGTSTTGMPPQDPGERVRIEQHVSDIKCALANLKASIDYKEGVTVPDPIIVAHSFGGLIVMKLLEDKELRQSLSGACLLCSIPPSGKGPMTQRFIKSKFLGSLKIVWGLAFKAATNDPAICRELFFDSTVPVQDIKK
jgi:pimeloyl-ACP methyl ester carboxylesterase